MKMIKACIVLHKNESSSKRAVTLLLSCIFIYSGVSIMRIHSSLLCSIALLCNCVYFSQLIASIIQVLLILGFDLGFFV